MAKGNGIKINVLEPTEEPVAPGRSIEVKVPGVDSKHVVVEVVTDTETKSYDQGEMHQDLEMKIPADDLGENYSVRVISIEQQEDGSEKRTLIAKS